MDKTVVLKTTNQFYEFLTGPAVVRTISICNMNETPAEVELKFRNSSSESRLTIGVEKSNMLKNGDFQIFLDGSDSISVRSNLEVHVVCSYSGVGSSEFFGKFLRSPDRPLPGEWNWGLARALFKNNPSGWEA